jgi:hypothetical protein
MSAVPQNSCKSAPLRLWLAVLIPVLIVLAVIFVNVSGSLKAKQDRLAVTSVDVQLAREMGEDPELRAAFGRFLRLEGKHYSRREYVWMMFPRIEWMRQAVFESGTLPVEVTLSADESISLGKQKWQMDWNFVPPSEVPPPPLEVQVQVLRESEIPHHITAVALSEDASLLVTAFTGRCEVWDTSSRQRVATVRGKLGWVDHIDIAEGTGKLVISSKESTQLIDPDAGTVLMKWTSVRPADIGKPRKPIDISRDGESVLGNFASFQQKPEGPKEIGASELASRFDPAIVKIAHIYREGRTEPVIATTEPPQIAAYVFLSPDGNFAMLGLSESSVEVWWDVRNERAIAEYIIGNPEAAQEYPWKGLVVFGPHSGDAFVSRMSKYDMDPPVRLALPSLAETVRFEAPPPFSRLSSCHGCIQRRTVACSHDRIRDPRVGRRNRKTS